MREVKFRAFVKPIQRFANRQFGFMIDVSEIDFNEKYVANDDGTVYYFDEIELLQYTDPKDSHGNEIYEGDIIEAVFELIDGELETIIDKGVVVFKDYAFQVQTFEDHHEPLHEWAQLSEELKVIGNIYENPELLPEVPQ